ncbi:MAG: hypothetical protein UY97_C0001G0076 [Parcubacteria group bacterium GW2011_GWB1_57_6]|nr:MAG: hypothetical protein UY97_C0001G0076 [Parcubacteria group bacterium GW2011_GWB1_57_6]
MRYLGIDYGSSKIGLALSDEAGSMGFPHSIVPNSPRIIEDLSALIAKENIGAVVIGESRTLSGGENPIAKGARALGDSLAERRAPRRAAYRGRRQNHAPRSVVRMWTRPPPHSFLPATYPVPTVDPNRHAMHSDRF